MKKKLYCLLMALAICMGAGAQSITVEDFEALSSGETISFYVHYSDINAMTSTHFEVNLPTGFTVEKVEATSDWAAIFSNEGGVVSAMSTSANSFSGEGNIARITITIPAGTTVDTYPVTITNIRINGNNLGVDPTFNIKVVSVHTITLYETSTTAPEAASGVNVRVKRTILPNEWSTICLPFAMTEEQVETAFGSDVQLGDFTGYETTEDENDEVEGITVKFNSVNISSGMKANRPYLIKVSSAVSEFTADNVDIDPEDEPTVAAVKRTKKQWSEMIGTYVAATVLDAQTLFLSGNRFWYSAGSTKMKAFRAYFDFYDVLTAVEEAYSSRIVMNFEDGKTTGVEEIEKMRNSGTESIFNLNGQRVSSPKKGLYIVNGKKVKM